jgi:hypothetical protein
MLKQEEKRLNLKFMEIVDDRMRVDILNTYELCTWEQLLRPAAFQCM